MNCDESDTQNEPSPYLSRGYSTNCSVRYDQNAVGTRPLFSVWSNRVPYTRTSFIHSRMREHVAASSGAQPRVYFVVEFESWNRVSFVRSIFFVVQSHVFAKRLVGRNGKNIQGQAIHQRLLLFRVVLLVLVILLLALLFLLNKLPSGQEPLIQGGGNVSSPQMRRFLMILDGTPFVVQGNISRLIVKAHSGDQILCQADECQDIWNFAQQGRQRLFLFGRSQSIQQWRHCR